MEREKIIQIIVNNEGNLVVLTSKGFIYEKVSKSGEDVIWREEILFSEVDYREQLSEEKEAKEAKEVKEAQVNL
ncbi:MAG TPA: hypothetical protein ENH35_02860 [Candidatus Moranbacteria bacterium]|nr:hypothetical protein [Candidatus Moranbacteria bacterium]